LSDEEIKQINTNPHSSPYMPRQESGIKPSCALPYQLYADGRLSGDRKSLELKFEAADAIFGGKAVGSPFNVYAPGKYLTDDVRTWAYAVKAGDNLTDSWPLHDFENDNYHLRVYGPNGFHREFMGTDADPDIEIICEYQRSSNNKLSGNIELKLHNFDAKTHQIELIDNAYHRNNAQKALNPGAKTTLILDLENSHNWYDFTVKVSGRQNFMKRYAGRVETGRHSFSDPFMGRVFS
jgi:phospholipase C